MQRILIAALLAATPLHAQDETEMKLTDVPEDVVDTAIATAPGVEFDRVSVEVENGVSIYEFESEDHEGKHIEIDVREDGKLEEIEMEISLDETPENVTEVLEETAPGFEPAYIEASTRPDGSTVYEFEGSIEGGEVDIEIDESGEVLVFADDNVS